MLKPMRLAILLATTLSVLNAQQAPRPLATDKTLVLQSDENGRRTWLSRRFTLESTADIPQGEMIRLTQVAEATVQAIASHPLPLFKPPAGDRMKLVILHDDSSYAAEGGQIGSAGMYLWRKRCVILHAQHLFASQGNTRLKPRANEALIVHEIAHLCMHDTPHQLPQWLKEGLCEYFAAAYQGAGRFTFNDPERSIREHLRSRFDPGDPLIQISPVQDIATLNSAEWSRYLTLLPPEERHFPYATGLLLTHYHLHGGPERREKLLAALTMNPRDPALPFPEIGAENSKIPEQLQRFWRPKGLQFEVAATSSRPRENDSPFEN